ncbi:WbqC family protein [bacterium]|nr:WbqC family protein [bacterium]
MRIPGKTSGLSGSIVAIHQPNFAPWPGYFNKMQAADIFIYLDNVPFSKSSFQNRNKLLVNGESKWLTVPVLTRGKYATMTNEIEINNQKNWRHKHLSTLRQNYCRCPHFNWVYESLEPIYRDVHENLSRFSMLINEEIRRMLEINTPIVLASDLAFTEGATERLVTLVNAVKGKTYLSGKGGKKYLEEEHFVKAGLKLEYQDFSLRPYPQIQSFFVPNLSTLDLLFNLGQNAAAWLRGELNDE